MSFSGWFVEDTVEVMTMVVVVSNGWGNMLACSFPPPSSSYSTSSLSFPLFFFFLRHVMVYGFGNGSPNV